MRIQSTQLNVLIAAKESLHQGIFGLLRTGDCCQGEQSLFATLWTLQKFARKLQRDSKLRIRPDYTQIRESESIFLGNLLIYQNLKRLFKEYAQITEWSFSFLISSSNKQEVSYLGVCTLNFGII